MNAIEVEGLVKEYGAQRALDGLSFEVPTGEVFGFLGPNGAGKTTAIRILLGLSKPDAGSAHLLGVDAFRNRSAVAARVGFLPDVPEFYGWMRGSEYLEFAARLFALEAVDARRRIGMLLEMVGLAGVTTKIGGYSRGMKQRLGLAQALINSPELLILDEPTSALDPLGRHELLSLIDELRGTTTVFFSTHILSDVERVCDSVAVLDRGRVLASGKTAELRATYGGSQRFRLEIAADPAHVGPVLSAQAWVTGAQFFSGSWWIDVRSVTDAEKAIPGLLAQNGWGLRRLELVEANLEEVFVKLVGGAR